MPRVLFLAFYFPPSRASGVFRNLSVANYLASNGWDVTVFAPQREFFTESIKSVDESLERTLHPAVRVERVHFPGRPWNVNLRDYGWFRGNFPTWSNALATRFENVIFPERYSPWIPRVASRALVLHRQQPFDFVFATGNPFSAFGAAWALGRLLRIPYGLDYRDSWTLNQFTEEPAFSTDDPVWKWERRVLNGSALISFVNSTQRDWYADRYPDASERMVVIENGFDPELFDGYDPHSAARSAGRHALQLGYVGTITQQLPLAEFFDGWRLARQDPLLSDAAVRLYGHLGFFPNAANRVAKALPLNDGVAVSYEGAVPKADLLQVYEYLDVLLLITPNSRYVTCGKVYEYMAAAKPIVSVNSPHAHARVPLEGYPLAFCVQSLDPTDVREALVSAAQAASNPDSTLIDKSREHAARHRREGQLKRLDGHLRNCVVA